MPSLTYKETTIELPNDLFWIDEYNWHPVEQNTQYSLTGALLVQSAMKQTGRPITLVSDDSFAWVDRLVLDQLRLWAAIAGAVLLLKMNNGIQYSVLFDHSQTAFSATPIADFSDPIPTDHYFVTLRFIEVQS